MGSSWKITLIFLASLLFFSSSLNAQIVFKELPGYKIKSSDSLFFDITQTRRIISLNGTWKVYSADDEEKNKVPVTIPSIFEGTGELVFEKAFTVTPEELKTNRLRLVFLGLNYTADISVNDVIIYRHSGGSFPFQIDLPKDILSTDKDNILSVKLYYKLDSENTIPLKQRFLFPRNFGGIFRDVYIHVTPNISITEHRLNTNYDPKKHEAEINLSAKVENRNFSTIADSEDVESFTFKSVVLNAAGNEVANSGEINFILKKNQKKDITQKITMRSPELWTPANPQSYNLSIELWSGGQLLDRSIHQFSVYSLNASKDSLTFNGGSFRLNGVTYVISFNNLGSLASYSQMESDIKTIKNLGFNSVRFYKTVPHPYYLYLCEKYGLLAFIELPLNSVPQGLTHDQNFIARSRNYLNNFVNAYSGYSAVAAVGFGGGYLPDLDSHVAFLRGLAAIAKKRFKLTYASFAGLNVKPIAGIDLYGLEFFNESPSKSDSKIKNLQGVLGKGKVFISSATYVSNIGNTDGYLNKHSFEAQAKYFEDLINYAEDNQISGYFINTMFDYRGDYASLVAGYNDENLYHLGILSEDRNTSRLSYKVIYSKLHNTEMVTIPIGSSRDDAPMIFILYGLALAILLGILVNSGRKFREDSSRALLRPYNFYADVRDQRIMSGYHSTVLAFIVSATGALVTANLLFYFRENLVLEKILLAFGSKGLIKAVSYLAWHPVMSLVWLTAGFIGITIFMIIIIKAASFFVRNRVFISSVYFSVVWSFLPYVLLIPVGIVLYRVLKVDIVNIYIYIALLIFAVWVFYRLIKGIYVIFDVNAGGVYFYTFVLALLFLGGIFAYFEMTNSVFLYLQLVIKQFNLLG